jgi:hypothetical protein
MDSVPDEYGIAMAHSGNPRFNEESSSKNFVEATRRKHYEHLH